MNTRQLVTVVSFHMLVVLIPGAALALARRPKAWPTVASICLGCIAGYASIHTDDAQLPAVFLLLFGLLLGFARPEKAWKWGLLMGMCVPAIEAGRAAMTGSSLITALQSCLAFAFSFGGAYMGKGVSALSRRGGEPSTGADGI